MISPRSFAGPRVRRGFIGAATTGQDGSAIVTGTIAVETAGSRAWRRQANRTLGATSLRRATSATFAPGSRLSAKDPHLLVARPSPPPLDTAQNFDPHPNRP